MVTFEEIAIENAEKIRKAARQTELVKTADEKKISKAFSKGDPLLQTLKNIQRSLDRYRYKRTKQPLSEVDKRKILKLIGEELKLKKPNNIIHIIKATSNENAIELSTYLSQFISELQEKEEE